MDSTQPVRIAEVDANGRVSFDLSFNLPEAAPGQRPPTERMNYAIDKFLGGVPNGITENQAHVLLALRDYAQACSARIFADRSFQTITTFARIIAAVISYNPEIAEDVLARGGRRFRAGTDGSNIARTKHFGAVETFCAAFSREVEAAGGVLE